MAVESPAGERHGGELADHVILTEGNGRGEPSEQVVAALMAGARPPGARIEVVLDRVVMGRGAMPRLLSNTAGEGPEFDDREVAREELSRLGYRAALSA